MDFSRDGYKQVGKPYYKCFLHDVWFDFFCAECLDEEMSLSISEQDRIDWKTAKMAMIESRKQYSET